MEINSYFTKPVSFNFKGYDARPLRAVVMTVSDDPRAFDVFQRMSAIGKKDGFDVYFTNQTNRLYKKPDTVKKFFEAGGSSGCSSGCSIFERYNKWTQDSAVLTPEKKIITHPYLVETGIAKRIATLTKSRINESMDFIEGGNLFFVKGNDSHKSYKLLIGSNETEGRTLEKLKKTYGVSSVHVIPSADYHLDVFLRPLNNGKILVADDTLTIKGIQRGIRGITKFKKTHNCNNEELKELDSTKEKLTQLLKLFKKDVKDCQNPNAEDVEKAIEAAGFEAIRVPGRIYELIKGRTSDDFIQEMNYLNAVVQERKDGTLTYITNKSALNEKCCITPEISEKIGFDFEKLFTDSVKDYIKKENIHFIGGPQNYISTLLENEGGGIHCLCNEIPLDILA